MKLWLLFSCLIEHHLGVFLVSLSLEIVGLKLLVNFLIFRALRLVLILISLNGIHCILQNLRLLTAHTLLFGGRGSAIATCQFFYAVVILEVYDNVLICTPGLYLGLQLHEFGLDLLELVGRARRRVQGIRCKLVLNLHHGVLLLH